MGPVLFALAGGGFGICWTMLTAESGGRVLLEDSLLGLWCGLVIGMFAGVSVQRYCNRFPQFIPLATVVATTLLAMSICPPMGWVMGDYHVVRDPLRGFVSGAIAGAVLGPAAGIAYLRWDRWKRRI
jgi:hypothetical protein